MPGIYFGGVDNDYVGNEVRWSPHSCIMGGGDFEDAVAIEESAAKRPDLDLEGAVPGVTAAAAIAPMAVTASAPPPAPPAMQPPAMQPPAVPPPAVPPAMPPPMPPPAMPPPVPAAAADPAMARFLGPGGDATAAIPAGGMMAPQQQMMGMQQPMGMAMGQPGVAQAVVIPN